MIVGSMRQAQSKRRWDDIVFTRLPAFPTLTPRLSHPAQLGPITHSVPHTTTRRKHFTALVAQRDAE
jgi:hypothetical protein